MYIYFYGPCGRISTMNSSYANINVGILYKGPRSLWRAQERLWLHLRGRGRGPMENYILYYQVSTLDIISFPPCALNESIHLHWLIKPIIGCMYEVGGEVFSPSYGSVIWVQSPWGSVRVLHFFARRNVSNHEPLTLISILSLSHSCLRLLTLCSPLLTSKQSKNWPPKMSITKRKL
jgi:hypothetical protein